MTFSPVIPFGGLQGWYFLSRTLENQASAFEKSYEISSDKEYFSDRISSVESADDLVSDPRLLRVALIAFGLEEDLPNRFLIKKVLSDGTSDADALANRFSDKRYYELSKAFGFGKDEVTRTQSSELSSLVLESYVRRSFEVSVGETHSDLRLALSLEGEVSKIADGQGSDTSKWLAVLGNPPLKEIFETALGIPAGSGQVDLDQQIGFLKDRFQKITGGEKFSDLLRSGNLDLIRQNFLLFSQIKSKPYGGDASIALRILQGGASIKY